MLATKEAYFYIRLILIRWYSENINTSKKLFLQADKFKGDYEQCMINKGAVVTYLYTFNQSKKDFHEEKLIILEQKAQLTNLLQEFVEENTRQPLSTKRLKSSYESYGLKIKHQRQ
ncbi:8187_t:CDS:2, partial [Scutellospora calospora]